MKATRRNGQSGFTLVELMVTVSVAAILLIIAVPNFTNLIRKSNVSSASNKLLVDIDYARSEAITRGTMVSICPSSTGTDCLVGSQTYDSGWLVYVNAAGDAPGAAYTAAGTILRYTEAMNGASIQAEYPAYISFGGQGTAGSGPPAGGVMDFLICYRSGLTGVGTSTTLVPGATLELEASGEIHPKPPLAAGAACNY